MKNQSNIILENAYGLLGLLPNSSQKEITKRTKEIEKFLQIDEIPSYDFDFGLYAQGRNFLNVRSAYFNLSNVSNQILHHYFRVYACNQEQLEILNKIEEKFVFKQILEIYEGINSKDFIFKKNIAIALTVLLLSEKVDKVISVSDFCIRLWFSIIYNEKYIKDYKKLFILDDELGIEESLFDNIQTKIVTELTKVFSDIANLYNNKKILSIFINKFQLNDTVFNLPSIEEIYDNICDSIKMLDSLNISDDGIFDNYEKKTLNECLISFKKEFAKLSDLGLYENEKTIILRDLVATKVRLQILDLYNNLDEDDVASSLMQYAISIVGTQGLKTKLIEEARSISSSIAISNYIKLAYALIEALSKKNGNIGTYEIREYIQKIRYICSSLNENNTISQDDKIKFSTVLSIRLRSISIDLHNQYNKFKESQLLLEFILEIVQTEEIRSVCMSDLNTVKETVSKRCGTGAVVDEAGGCIFSFLANILSYIIVIGVFALFSLIFS